MLRDSKAFSSFSVNDVHAAKQFYCDILGLNVEETPEGLGLTLTGGMSVFLYPKQDHEPASFTVLNFSVDNVESSVRRLKDHGVRFEHYDMPDLKTDEDGIFRAANSPTIAWFRDPSGNILSVLQERTDGRR